MASKKVPKGYHRMPDGKLMKNSAHKKSENDFRDSEVKRKQYRGWDRDAKLMNGFAEQEYKRRKPKLKYDKATLPKSATVGPDTGRTGKHNARTQTGVQRRPLKGPKRKPAIQKPVYRGQPNNRRDMIDYWKI